MNPDRITLSGGGRAMQLTVVIAALIGSAFALIAGAKALIETLLALGLPFRVAIAGPIVLDGMMVTAAAALIVRRSQGRTTRFEFTTLVGLTMLSALVQFLHAWDATDGLALTVRIPAIAVATALPLLILAGEELAVRAVLVEKVKRNRAVTPTARPVASATTPITQSVETSPAPTTVRPVATAATPGVRPAASSPTDELAPTMTLEEAATHFVAGMLSQRNAAIAAGVTVSAIRKAAEPLRERVAA